MEMIGKSSFQGADRRADSGELPPVESVDLGTVILSHLFSHFKNFRIEDLQV